MERVFAWLGADVELDQGLAGGAANEAAGLRRHGVEMEAVERLALLPDAAVAVAVGAEAVARMSVAPIDSVTARMYASERLRAVVQPVPSAAICWIVRYWGA